MSPLPDFQPASKETRTPSRSLLPRLALFTILLSLLGCGGDNPTADENSEPPPQRPADLAAELAARADRPPGFPSLIGQSERPRSRIFRKLGTSDLETLDTLAEAYRSSTDPYDQIEAIEAMSELYSEKLVTILQEALTNQHPEVRASALGVLAGSTSPSVIPIAMAALLDPDESVRLAIPDVLRNIPDLNVVPVFLQGLVDSSVDVRFAFLDAAAEMSPGIRNPVLEGGLQSDDGDIREFSLTYLKMELSHTGFEILLGGLDSPDEGFRENVSMEIDMIVGETFTSSAEARSWWAANRKKYDRDLFLLE